ncbi:hypothetical protein XM53_11525 [Roseovarius atlanticus]|uniref:AAA+ family ATPase n=1 Tax=Roseovarius atlanticus TaxID=1641875 RepID=A0A0T5NTL2_9RHOB|nr:hypothetical protein [Roseovarius atlanticus]KRS12274.1 hypothetical protein XM53_11525 [Roseovarius atlanticus]
MKQIASIAALSLTLAAAPALAQEEEDEGFSLMERGAQMFMEGIMREMEPAMRDLEGLAQEMEPAVRNFVQEMGPAFADLMGQIDDLSNYHAPEILENGDIIIRRKTPLEDEVDPDGDGEIEI